MFAQGWKLTRLQALLFLIKHGQILAGRSLYPMTICTEEQISQDMKGHWNHFMTLASLSFLLHREYRHIHESTDHHYWNSSTDPNANANLQSFHPNFVDEGCVNTHTTVSHQFFLGQAHLERQKIGQSLPKKHAICCGSSMWFVKRRICPSFFLKSL